MSLTTKAVFYGSLLLVYFLLIGVALRDWSSSQTTNDVSPEEATSLVPSQVYIIPAGWKYFDAPIKAVAKHRITVELRSRNRHIKYLRDRLVEMGATLVKPNKHRTKLMVEISLGDLEDNMYVRFFTFATEDEQYVVRSLIPYSLPEDMAARIHNITGINDFPPAQGFGLTDKAVIPVRYDLTTNTLVDMRPAPPRKHAPLELPSNEEGLPYSDGALPSPEPHAAIGHELPMPEPQPGPGDQAQPVTNEVRSQSQILLGLILPLWTVPALIAVFQLHSLYSEYCGVTAAVLGPVVESHLSKEPVAVGPHTPSEGGATPRAPTRRDNVGGKAKPPGAAAAKSRGCGEETPDQCAKGKSKGKDNRVRQQKRTTVVTSPSCSPPPTRPATPANERAELPVSRESASGPRSRSPLAPRVTTTVAELTTQKIAKPQGAAAHATEASETSAAPGIHAAPLLEPVLPAEQMKTNPGQEVTHMELPAAQDVSPEDKPSEESAVAIATTSQQPLTSTTHEVQVPGRSARKTKTVRKPKGVMAKHSVTVADVQLQEPQDAVVAGEQVRPPVEDPSPDAAEQNSKAAGRLPDLEGPRPQPHAVSVPEPVRAVPDAPVHSRGRSDGPAETPAGPREDATEPRKWPSPAPLAHPIPPGRPEATPSQAPVPPRGGAPPPPAAPAQTLQRPVHASPPLAAQAPQPVARPPQPPSARAAGPPARAPLPTAAQTPHAPPQQPEVEGPDEASVRAEQLAKVRARIAAQQQARRGGVMGSRSDRRTPDVPGSWHAQAPPSKMPPPRMAATPSSGSAPAALEHPMSQLLGPHPMPPSSAQPALSLAPGAQLSRNNFAPKPQFPEVAQGIARSDPIGTPREEGQRADAAEDTDLFRGLFVTQKSAGSEDSAPVLMSFPGDAAETIVGAEFTAFQDFVQHDLVSTLSAAEMDLTKVVSFQ